MDIDFEYFTGDDGQIKILYDLLSKRNHQISHTQMPSYAQHCDFVRNHPYVSWYLVKVSGSYIGSFYVTDQNTIGINILNDWVGSTVSAVIDQIKSKFIPLPAIKSVRSEFYSINVAPGNAELIYALERSGCVLAQLSYVIM
jgi:hypothetical protein